STGTARTARGGSRSSRASTARTTSSSTASGSARPLPPEASAPLRLLDRVAHLFAVRLQGARGLEVRERLAALAELHQRVAEVVVGVRGAEVAATGELRDRVLEERKRLGVAARLHQLVGAVVLVVGVPADAGGRRR